jgi:hypothetical protein
VYFAVGHAISPFTANLVVESQVFAEALIQGPSAEAPGAFAFPALHANSFPTPAPLVVTKSSPIGNFVGSTFAPVQTFTIDPDVAVVPATVVATAVLAVAAVVAVAAFVVVTEVFFAVITGLRFGFGFVLDVAFAIPAPVPASTSPAERIKAMVFPFEARETERTGVGDLFVISTPWISNLKGRSEAQGNILRIHIKIPSAIRS